MKTKETISLSDGSKLRVLNNGNKYTVVSVENESLFNYMQDCKINIRQSHKHIDYIIKCFNRSLCDMSHESPSDSFFKSTLVYKPNKIFVKRCYSRFKLH